MNKFNKVSHTVMFLFYIDHCPAVVVGPLDHLPFQWCLLVEADSEHVVSGVCSCEWAWHLNIYRWMVGNCHQYHQFLTRTWNKPLLCLPALSPSHHWRIQKMHGWFPCWPANKNKHTHCVPKSRLIHTRKNSCQSPSIPTVQATPKSINFTVIIWKKDLRTT